MHTLFTNKTNIEKFLGTYKLSCSLLTSHHYIILK